MRKTMLEEEEKKQGLSVEQVRVCAVYTHSRPNTTLSGPMTRSVVRHSLPYVMLATATSSAHSIMTKRVGRMRSNTAQARQ